MEDRPPQATQGEVPRVPGDPDARRRLERAPSERYAPPDAAAPPTAASPPVARGPVLAVAAAIAGGIILAIAGGLLTMTAGLLAVAAVLGWIVGATLSSGVTTHSGRTGRRWLAAAIALAGVALGQLGLWLIARQEGGTLGPVDYLAEVFGVLVPAQLGLAALTAWWRAA
jgi:hypothetical protein